MISWNFIKYTLVMLFRSSGFYWQVQGSFRILLNFNWMFRLSFDWSRGHVNNFTCLGFYFVDITNFLLKQSCSVMLHWSVKSSQWTSLVFLLISWIFLNEVLCGLHAQMKSVSKTQPWFLWRRDLAALCSQDYRHLTMGYLQWRRVSHSMEIVD